MPVERSLATSSMGIKETDSYGGGGHGEDKSKLPRLSRGFRAALNNWFEDLRGSDDDPVSASRCVYASGAGIPRVLPARASRANGVKVVLCDGRC